MRCPGKAGATAAIISGTLPFAKASRGSAAGPRAIRDRTGAVLLREMDALDAADGVGGWCAQASSARSAASIAAWRRATSLPIGGPWKRRRSKPNHSTADNSRKAAVIHRAASLGGCTPR